MTIPERTAPVLALAAVVGAVTEGAAGVVCTGFVLAAAAGAAAGKLLSVTATMCSPALAARALAAE